MPSSGPLLLATILFGLSVSLRSEVSQERLADERPVELAPISWTCPMDPEVLEAEEGRCPICRMDLVPIRLETVWSCPVHSVVSETAPGKCPICRRDLAQVTVALSWTCPDRPEIDQLNPGRCPDGAAMAPKHTPRAHGNHNPQHGGFFFMAPDNWHHLEGTYPQEGLFRLHLYDDYSKPLPAEKLKQVRGRIVTKETFDSATRTTREVVAYPLVPSASGQYLEATIQPLSPPAQMTAKIRVAGDGPEYHFDFTFPVFSRDLAGDRTAIASANVDPSQLPIEIPDNATDVLALLGARNRQIEELIERGAFGDLYVPAFQAKDLALALDVRAGELPVGRRVRATPAIKRLVRSAWLLDAYGDLGNRRRITEAYATFSAAVAEIEAAFEGERRQ